MSAEHQTPIKTPQQLIWVIVLAFVVPVLLISLLAKFVASGTRTGAGSDSMLPAAIENRIRPVAGLELRDVNAPRQLKSGEDVYKAQCSACHAQGVAGAPKFADAAAWSARLGTGLQALTNSALKGKGAMPAQSGGDFDDLEIARAVHFMTSAAGGKFEAPNPPAK